MHKDGLNIDELQFGFQQDTSTNMCTSLAVETREYYLRNGSDVFACVMDMTKAFDKVRHSKLFWKLVEKGIPPIFIRLLLEYEKQQTNVRWIGVLSNPFPVQCYLLFYTAYTSMASLHALGKRKQGAG